MFDNFVNPVFMNLEQRVRDYVDGRGDEELEDIMRDIREASLYGKIQSYEEIRLLDLMELEEAEDIDDGYVNMPDETTGGIQTSFEKEETHDMSYLDDYETEEEEKQEGFLNYVTAEDDLEDLDDEDDEWE